MVLQLLLSLFLGSVWAVESKPPIAVKNGKSMEEISPYTLFFPPLKNNIYLERQKVDYDLTEKSSLRMGPYLLSEDAVSIQMTREQGEFFEVEFGLEVKRRIGPIYVISFRWPKDYIKSGFLEIINDKGESYWRRELTDEDVKNWKELVIEQREISDDERLKLVKQAAGSKAQKTFGLARPQALNKKHARSIFGLAHRAFYEIPIAQIREPFRFCVSQEDDGKGRTALCSRRYQFARKFGRFSLRPVSKKVRPRVLVNDKPVTLKGTVVFLDYETPIKFSALLSNGTYYEFISKPKDIYLVDLVYDKQADRIEVVGYGDQPMGQIDESFFADTVHWGFLNFMPTIGDLKRYWRASISPRQASLYLKGDGGAPFRQSFTFDALPSQDARATLSKTTQRSTYSETATLEGKLSANSEVSSEDSETRRLDPETFEWEFLAPDSGGYNTDILTIEENGVKWQAEYQIWRGYPGEFSTRLTGIASFELDLVLLGEVAAQYWFEKMFGWDDYRFSKLRWGVLARHFRSLAVLKEDEENQGIVDLNVTNIDLKYRLTPGIWGRDPTVGLIFAFQSMEYGFRQNSTDFTSTNMMGGAGLFWARSMPKIFDDLFNIIPWFRYPKWVDMEAVWYPVPLDGDKTTSVQTLSFNFHGKVQWTKRWFGEAGFGLKNFAYDDPTIGELNNQGNPRGKVISLGIAYGTIGAGFNF